LGMGTNSCPRAALYKQVGERIRPDGRTSRKRDRAVKAVIGYRKPVVFYEIAWENSVSYLKSMFSLVPWL